MAISKVTLNGETQMDVTGDTVAANHLLNGDTATGANGEQLTGTLQVDVVVDPTLSNTGEAADAKATGDKIITLENDITGLNAYNILDLCAKTNQTFQGVKYEWNRDGSCNVSQTATATSFNNIFASQTSLPSGIRAGDILDIQYSSKNVYLYLYDYSTSSPVVIWGGKTGTRIKIPTTCTGMIIRLWVANGTAVGNPGETINPIIINSSRYFKNTETVYGSGGSAAPYLLYSDANSVNENCKFFVSVINGSPAVANCPAWAGELQTVYITENISIQTYYPYQPDLHNTKIRTKVNGTWGSWVNIANTIPDPPTTNGTYTLRCVVSSGTPTYSWVSV